MADSRKPNKTFNVGMQLLRACIVLILVGLYIWQRQIIYLVILGVMIIIAVVALIFRKRIRARLEEAVQTAKRENQRPSEEDDEREESE